MRFPPHPTKNIADECCSSTIALERLNETIKIAIESMMKKSSYCIAVADLRLFFDVMESSCFYVMHTVIR